jgi:Flp pilus assembly pilin Flp
MTVRLSDSTWSYPEGTRRPDSFDDGTRGAHYTARSRSLLSEAKEMDFLKRMLVRLTEAKRDEAGQTMTEYVLIIAAIAVAGYIAYQGLETGINGLITKVTASLNAA